MTTYNLKNVQEATVVGTSVTIYSTVVPIDNNGNVPDYLSKDRIIQNNQMLVFDTYQEYSDYINQIVNP